MLGRGVVVVCVMAMGSSAALAQDAANAEAFQQFDAVESGGGWTDDDPGSASSWDRGYIGVHVGKTGALDDDMMANDPEGWSGGVDAGVNYVLRGGIVVGLAGDVSWGDTAAADGEIQLDATGSLRGRVGLDGGQFLPYLTAGAAFGAGAEAEAEIDNLHWGWTAGAGVEFALTEQFSVDTAWRYTSLGEAEYGEASLGWDYHQFTIGLNWGF